MTRNEIGGAQVKGSSLATPEELSAKRILIAEDNAVNRLMIARQMKRLGLAADIVNNGADALTALDARNYDLLITDCAMPGVDGFELTATIREREIAGDRRLPIIALSAPVRKSSPSRLRLVDVILGCGSHQYTGNRPNI